MIPDTVVRGMYCALLRNNQSISGPRANLYPLQGQLRILFEVCSQYFFSMFTQKVCLPIFFWLSFLTRSPFSSCLTGLYPPFFVISLPSLHSTLSSPIVDEWRWLLRGSFCCQSTVEIGGASAFLIESISRHHHRQFCARRRPNPLVVGVLVHVRSPSPCQYHAVNHK